MDAYVNNAEIPVDMCSRYQQLEDSDDKCIILIHFFGGYSVSKVLHVEHSKGIGSGQIYSFLIEMEH